MGKAFVSILLRRMLTRWKTPCLLFLMAGLMWLAFLSIEKRNGSNSALDDANSALDDANSALDIANKQTLKLINIKAPNWKLGLEEKIIDTDGARGGGLLGDEIVIQPLARRGPMPVVYDMALENQQLNEEENAAQEQVDVLKETESVKVDDDAAREEHSGEVAMPGIAKERQVMFNNAETIKVPDNVIKHQKKIIDNRKSGEIVQVAENTREQEESFHQLPEHQKDLPEEKYDSYNNWRNLSHAEIGKLSVLGRRLFLNEKVGQEQNRTYTIHVWKYMKHLASRHLFRYGKEAVDPFEGCSVTNCKITSEDDQVTKADAVLFHLHRIDLPPANVTRKKGQIWVWLSDESPYNVFMMAKDRNLEHYSGYFDWSMTYRIDSDVPVPYGRTVPLPKDQYLEKVENMYSIKKKDIAILGSNCGGINGRYKYIKELQKFISVDIYGGCGPLKCEGHFRKDCPKLDQYKFYLAFENSNCDDYITEKVWWNALHKGAVPVVMGANKNNYARLLPPGSFIFAEDFHTPEHLAEYLKHLLKNPTLYEEYHTWRRWYRVLNEHGYFQSPVFHFCRLCEALNYNSRPQEGATADLTPFFNSRQHCYDATWKPS